jgi:predicted RND superfamily exporter protein
MKKKFLLSILVLIFMLFCLSGYSQENDFRKTNWGMTKEEVKSTENNKIIDEDLGSTEEVIVYKDQISSFDCFIGYIFVKNKLASAGYYINEEHSNKNVYIDDYEKLKDLLSKKYGNPIRDDVIWRDDLYKEDKSEWGLAISIGDLAYKALWETPTTEIELLLSGDNYNIELGIKYVSKELKDWANEIVKEDTLQDL